ncbi:ABC1 kinase family protein [Streptomyces sp. NPDC058682]|uniref:ABC1 kinase family protein n=1 Tax=unclassified Streptomyces TaxID=2593676 RepID=UPI0022561AF7|nr:AarF/UbiB family protein [Streptomyces sp. NBC_01214]MCX4803102.1 AarF/UbiB family protein [Streptomyces sp. NBC_01214]
MHPAVLLPVALLTTTIVLLGLTAGARRLLGLQPGKGRTVLTAAVGLMATIAVGFAMREQEQSPGLASVQFGSGLLAAMGFLFVAEIVFPKGAWTGLMSWPRSLRRRLARARRYALLSRIVVRHGLGRFLRHRARNGPAAGDERARLAPSLRLAMEEAGVTFIKMGQVLSTRYDMMPPELIAELGKLHHQATPDPWDAVERLIREELGSDPWEVFDEFDREALAAGSIAQVHRARLKDGSEVVVKVQRPSSESVVVDDLEILLRFARKVQQRTEWGRNVNAVALAEGFAASLHEELDFRTEAQNMIAVSTAMSTAAADRMIHLPAVYESLSTRRMLITEWLDGVPLNSAAGVLREQEADPMALAQQLLGCMLHQVMVGGVFHADPHPGNVLLLRDGRLALLDFGSVGRIDRVFRSTLRNILVAVHRNDPMALCDALLELVSHPEDIDERALERALGRFLARHFAPGLRPDRDMFTHLFQLVSRHGLNVPPELAAVFRSLATLEGSLGRLVPEFDIVAGAREYAVALHTEKFQPGTLSRTLADEAIGLVPILRRIPRRIDRIGSAIENGRLTVNVRMLADPRDRRFVRTLVHETLLTVLSSTIGLMAVLLIRTDGGPRLGSSLSLFQLIGYNLLVLSGVLVLRTLFAIFKAQR